MVAVALSALAGAGWQFFDNNGIPLDGGLLYTYGAGGTTPATTYQTSAGDPGSTNTNPIILDSYGRLPAECWLVQANSYKFQLNTAADVPVRTYDNIPGIASAASLAVVAADLLAYEALLAASGGSALVGFIQSAANGAAASTVQAELRRTVYAAQFTGFVADGATDCTTALTNAMARAAGGDLILPSGTIIASQITIPSNTRLIGQGQGNTILKQKAATSAHFVINSDNVSGNTGIRLEALTVDGNGVNQSAGYNAVLMDKVSKSFYNIEVKNGAAMGFSNSGGGDNVYGLQMYSHSNAVLSAGYALYIYNSDKNLIFGRYDSSAIGLVIESAGVGGHSNFNRIIGVYCEGNAAVFGQSGAGIHFEQTVGNNCDYCEVVGAVVAVNALGISNSGVGLVVTGGQIYGNSGAGISTLAATGFVYTGVKFYNNGLGAGAGYKQEMRFDDSIVSSSGDVIGCYARGTTAEAAFETTSTGSAVRFIDNDVAGYAVNYVLSGTADVLSRHEHGTFTATMTGGVGGITGTANYAINGQAVTVELPVLLGSSGGGVTCGFSGVPSTIYPVRALTVPVIVTNNSVDVQGRLDVATNGIGTLGVGGTASGFNTGGNKGLPATTLTWRLA